MAVKGELSTVISLGDDQTRITCDVDDVGKITGNHHTTSRTYYATFVQQRDVTFVVFLHIYVYMH